MRYDSFQSRLFLTSLCCLSRSSKSKYCHNSISQFTMLYSVLSFECHITVICKSCYFNIRSIYRIRTFLSAEYRKIFVNAFVTSRRENCNSLLYGLPCGLLHSSLNCAVHLIVGGCKYNHITP